MKKFKRLVCTGLISVLLCGIISACSKDAKTDETDATVTPNEQVEELETTPNVRVAPKDGVVLASAGDYKVYLTDYAYFYFYNKTAIENDALNNGYTEDMLIDIWTDDQSGTSMEQLLQDSSLETAKQYMQLYDEALKNGTVVDEAVITQVTSEIDNLLAQFDAENAEQQFINYYGQTSNQMKEMSKKLEFVFQYFDDLQSGFVVTDDEVKAEYDNNTDLYDKVTVRHILVLCDDTMTEEEQIEAKERADDIYQQVQDGADVGTLAKEYSEDSGSKDNNGEYTFGKSEMVEEFEEWAFAANNGDIGMVKTSYGYHIMSMIDRISYDEISGDVKNTMLAEMLDTKIDSMLNDNPVEWEVDNSALNSITLY